METRLRYSSSLSYNTFPFPQISTEKKQEIESAAKKVLITREYYPEKTLQSSMILTRCRRICVRLMPSWMTSWRAAILAIPSPQKKPAWSVSSSSTRR